MTIRVVDHDPSWSQVFETIKADLERELAAVEVVAIEHVGSTSVPGLAAKPIIDIDVVVRRECLDAAITALVAAGYEHLGDLGIEDRHAFHEPDEPARHVYVTVDGCLSLRNHLGVRDVLRSDPQLRTEYGELKKRLAAQYTADEIDHYVEAKSVVIQKVLSKAGLLPDELAFVDDVNRPPSRDEAST